MFLIKLFNIIKGYVEIIVEGFFPERFLNICTRRGIYLWNVKRLGKTKMSANISIKAFKALPPIAKKSKCSVHIKNRNGMPFFAHKYRKRKAFLIGIVIFMALIYTMKMYIWVIDVSGNEKIPKEQIISVLEQCGIKTGILNSKVDDFYAQNYIMTTIPDIAWVGINVKGTTVLVEVKERVEKPPLFEKDKPCNIVSKADGVIDEIIVKSGQKVVSKSDVVHKGQLLVSGAVDSTKQGVRYMHSDAEIKAKTWHETTVTLPQYEEIKTRTKNNKSKHSLKIFDFYVKLYLSDKVPFENFDRVSYVKSLSLGNNNILPISFHYDNYYELDVSQREMTNDETIEKVKSKMDEELKDIQITDKKVTVDGNKLTVVYECLEDIVEKTEILHEEEMYGSDGKTP